MALQGTLAADQNIYGYAFTACYARAIEVRSEFLSSFIDVKYWADRDARDANAVIVKSAVFPLATADLPPASNPIESAYLWLKTLPEFAGWIDV